MKSEIYSFMLLTFMMIEPVLGIISETGSFEICTFGESLTNGCRIEKYEVVTKSYGGD